MLTNNMQLILGLVLGFFFSTLGILVQYFLDRDKSKNERLFQYNKEIYFNLQKKTEEILAEINKYDDYIKKCVLTISLNKVEPLKYFTEEKINEHFKTKEMLASYIFLYYPNIEDKYKDFACLIDKILDAFLNLINNKNINQNDRNSVSDYKNKYDNLKNSLVKALREEMNNINSKLNK